MTRLLGEMLWFGLWAGLLGAALGWGYAFLQGANLWPLTGLLTGAVGFAAGTLLRGILAVVRR